MLSQLLDTKREAKGDALILNPEFCFNSAHPLLWIAPIGREGTRNAKVVREKLLQTHAHIALATLVNVNA